MSPYPLFRDRIDAGEQLAQAIHAILLQKAADGVCPLVCVCAATRDYQWQHRWRPLSCP